MREDIEELFSEDGFAEVIERLAREAERRKIQNELLSKRIMELETKCRALQALLDEKNTAEKV